MKKLYKFRWQNADGTWDEWQTERLNKTTIDRMYISASMRGIKVEVVEA